MFLVANAIQMCDLAEVFAHLEHVASAFVEVAYETSIAKISIGALQASREAALANLAKHLKLRRILPNVLETLLDGTHRQPLPPRAGIIRAISR